MSTCKNVGHAWDAEDVCSRCDHVRGQKVVTRKMGKPAQVAYKDEGCEGVSDSCLTCPLAHCKYDDWPAYLLHVGKTFVSQRGHA